MAFVALPKSQTCFAVVVFVVVVVGGGGGGGVANRNGRVRRWMVWFGWLGLVGSTSVRLMNVLKRISLSVKI